MFYSGSVFVSGICSKYTLRSDQCVATDVGGAKAAGESSKPFVRKAHDDRRHFIDFLEPGLPVTSAARQDRCRLSSKQITGGVDAINAHIVDRPASLLHGSPRVR
jgi:hypothetical protein